MYIIDMHVPSSQICRSNLKRVDYEYRRGRAVLSVGTFGKEQWDQLLGHRGAVTDQPAILFAAELLEAYPDAKVVIVKRDVESWYRSIKALFATSLDPAFLFFRFTDPFWIGRIIEVGVVSFGYVFGQAKTPTIAGIGLGAAVRVFGEARARCAFPAFERVEGFEGFV
jgi:hypothetical protein